LAQFSAQSIRAASQAAHGSKEIAIASEHGMDGTEANNPNALVAIATHGAASDSPFGHGATDLRAALEHAQGYRRRAETAEAAVAASDEARQQAEEERESAAARADALRDAIAGEREQWGSIANKLRSDLATARSTLAETETKLKQTQGALDTAQSVGEERQKTIDRLQEELSALQRQLKSDAEASELAIANLQSQMQ